jgi:hypothetical protein
VSTDRSIHAVLSLSGTPRERIDKRSRGLRVRTRSVTRVGLPPAG